MPPEPLIDWPDPLLELLEFVAAFWVAGACGFRFAVIRGVRRSGLTNGSRDPLLATALRRAAWIGLAGGFVRIAQRRLRPAGAAARQHTTVAALLTSFTPAALRFWMTLLVSLGFVVVLVRRDWGWWLAAIGLLGATFRKRAVRPVARAPQTGALAGRRAVDRNVVRSRGGWNRAGARCANAARTAWHARGRDGAWVLAAGAGRRGSAGVLRHRPGMARAAAARLAVDDAVGQDADRQAHGGAGGGGTRSLELAAPEAAAGKRRRGAVAASLRRRRAGRGRPGARRHRDLDQLPDPK
jgi:hypothetical protein